ncbi:MAG: efflux RND transporter permease subunit [Proteobacteria bacterium]|nr:efflux RND transporter permease subunit [Pseudomonadota bacterium]
MKPMDWIGAHARSILFLLVLLAVGGIVAAFKLPVTLFPKANFPRVVIELDAGDRPADLMAVQVTRPVEEAIRRVADVQNLRSTTSRGTAEVSVDFAWGTNMGLASAHVSEAVNQILPSLPPGTQLITRRMDPTTVFPIIAYSITSPNRSLRELYDLAQYQLRPALFGVHGVARVEVIGGAVEEYQIAVDPAKLHAYGLTMADVARALSASNVITALGRLVDHYKLYLVVGDTRLQSRAQIGEVVLRAAANGMVRLRDVASVGDGEVPRWQRVTADGHDAVLLSIFQQPGSNSVDVAAGVKAQLAAQHALVPADVTLANWYDQSLLVVESATSVRDAILIGAGLAALVLLLFLRNLKLTLIALVVVPTVLAATVLLLMVLGMGFNIMTMGGMAAAVGLIIDDAMVMTEHIVRRARGGGAWQRGRALLAAAEFTRPLAGSSLATIVIFVPLAFLTGVTGAFFKALSLTMAAGLVISFIVTWFAVPLLADRFLGLRDAQGEDGGRLTRWIHARYRGLMERLLARPWLVLLLVVPLLALGALAYQRVGSGFMPAMDEGGFVLDYRSSAGTSLAETDRLLRQVEAIIQQTPEVATYSRRTGTQMGGWLTEANQGDFFIRLKPGPRPPIDAIMDGIRTRVEREVPGLKVESAQLMEDVIGDLTAVPQPIEVKLFSDDAQQLQQLARTVARAIAGVPGVVDVRDGIRPAGDALNIEVDRDKAALEGMDSAAVVQLVQADIAGTVATAIQQGPKMIGVRVWLPRGAVSTDTQLAELLLRAPDGHVFPLQRVASVTAVSGQPEIARENLKRMIAVTARISGRDLGSTVRDVRAALAQPELLPPGTYFELGGLYRQQQIAFKGLAQVFVAAVALVFLLLLFLYERFRVALAIIAMPLLAMSAVFMGLWSSGVELNISSMMGMTMILGIVTEVAIFYFSEYMELAREGTPRQALIEAGVNRMRPIAMTTVAAILTLLPLALAIGQGAQMQQPLAIAIIAGLVVQLPLVLLVMPVLFQAMGGGGRRSS